MAEKINSKKSVALVSMNDKLFTQVIFIELNFPNLSDFDIELVSQVFNLAFGVWYLLIEFLYNIGFSFGIWLYVLFFIDWDFPVISLTALWELAL